MILAILRIEVNPSKKKDVFNIFDYLTGKISMKQGCKCINLYSSMKNENSLIYIEEWDSMSDLMRHIQSNDFRKIMTAMDLATEMPEMKFHSVSSSSGFELVERLRQENSDI